MSEKYVLIVVLILSSFLFSSFVSAHAGNHGGCFVNGCPFGHSTSQAYPNNCPWTDSDCLQTLESGCDMRSSGTVGSLAGVIDICAHGITIDCSGNAVNAIYTENYYGNPGALLPNNVVIKNCISNDVRISGSSHQIIDNNLQALIVGDFGGSQSVDIKRNDVSSIRLESATSTTIENNDKVVSIFTGFAGSPNTIVQYNTFSNGNIQLVDSPNAVIKNNLIPASPSTSSPRYAISLSNSPNSIIKENQVSNQGLVSLSFSSDNTMISSNVLTGSTANPTPAIQGIKVVGSKNIQITNNYIGKNSQQINRGIDFTQANAVNISNNVMCENFRFGEGIWLFANDSIVENNIIQNSTGITIGGYNSVIRGNTILNTSDVAQSYGILIFDGTYTIENNKIIGITSTVPSTQISGIWHQTGNSSITNNIIADSQYDGLSFLGTSKFTVDANTIVRNKGVGVNTGGIGAGGQVTKNIICSNTVKDIVNLSATGGDSNTCDTTYNWKDASAVAGCVYTCGPVNIQEPSTNCIPPKIIAGRCPPNCGVKVSGFVTDGHTYGEENPTHPSASSLRPLKKVNVTLQIENGESISTFTNETGDYTINSRVDENGGYNAYIRIGLVDEKNEIAIFDFEGDPQKATNFRTARFPLNTAEIVKDVNALQTGTLDPTGHNALSIDRLDDLAYIYGNTKEAADVTTGTLRFTMDYALPVEVYAWAPVPTQYCSTPGTTATSNCRFGVNHLVLTKIALDSGDSPLTTHDAPINREWHEFGHHVLFDSLIGGENSAPPKTGVYNHLGYANTNTQDSWNEGFADFFALLVEDTFNAHRHPNTRLYPVGAASVYDVEQSLTVWHKRGKKENMAIAGILWDLYDTNAHNPTGIDDDNVAVPIRQIWDNMLNMNTATGTGGTRDDLRDVYDAIGSSGLVNNADRDTIFIVQGAYHDLDDAGRFSYQTGEVVGNAAHDWRFATSKYDFNDDGQINKWSIGAPAPACPNPPSGPFMDLDGDRDADLGWYNTDSGDLTDDIPRGSAIHIYDADRDLDYSTCDDDGDGIGDMYDAWPLILEESDRRNIQADPPFLALDIANNVTNNATLSVSIVYDPPYQAYGHNYSTKSEITFPALIDFWVSSLPSKATIILEKEGFMNVNPLVINSSFYQSNADNFDTILLNHTFILIGERNATIAIQGTPTVGKSFNLTISDPDNPGLVYVLFMGVSGTSPGIPVGNGQFIPVNFDSVVTTVIFQGSLIGFTNHIGILDSNGQATITWNIPNIPIVSQITFYESCITVNATEPLPQAVKGICVPPVQFTPMISTGTGFGVALRLTNNTADSLYASLSIDQQGNSHVAWTDARNGNAEIYYHKQDQQGNILVHKRITQNAALSWDPSVIAFAGGAHLAWTDTRDGNAEIYYQQLDALGNPLTQDLRLTTNTADSFSPAITRDSFGKVHVAWVDMRDGNPEIYYTQLTNSTLLPPIRVTNDPAFSLQPAIAADSSDNLHIAWTDGRNGNSEIYYAKLNQAGQILIPSRRITTTNDDSSFPSIVADQQGNAHIMWSDARDGNTEIYYAKLDASGNILVEKRITQDSSTSWFPSLAIDTIGNLDLAWTDGRDANNEIYYAKLDNNGNSIDPPKRLTNDPADSSLPSIAVDGSNNPHIVWNDNRDGNTEIYYIQS